MQILILAVGSKTTRLDEAIQEYSRRVTKYSKLDWQILPSPKRQLSVDEQKKLESKVILGALKPLDYVLLLDERGEHWSTVQLSEKLEELRLHSTKRLVVVIGGAHGVGRGIFDRADKVLALSKMTLPHEMVRLMLIEQIYRAFTVLAGEPYHHQ